MEFIGAGVLRGIIRCSDEVASTEVLLVLN
jgi:hypothetical protein